MGNQVLRGPFSQQDVGAMNRLDRNPLVEFELMSLTRSKIVLPVPPKGRLLAARFTISVVQILEHVGTFARYLQFLSIDIYLAHCLLLYQKGQHPA